MAMAAKARLSHRNSSRGGRRANRISATPPASRIAAVELKIAFSDVHAPPAASSGSWWPAAIATAMNSTAAIVAIVGTMTASSRALRSGARLAPYSTSTSTAANVSEAKPTIQLL